jgi:two-component system response regulator AtoC
MQTSGRTILVGEDELEVRGYLQMALRCLGYNVELAQDGDEVLSILRSSPEVQAVVLDVMMPNRDGMDTLREIREFDPKLPVIMISGSASTLDVVSAMKSGATDFLSKPIAHEDLRKAIARAIDGNGAMYAPPARNGAPQQAGLFLGSHPRMREIEATLEQIGWSEAPVLIQGETGSGKEVLARELNARSPRANKPFLKLNCAALPSELVESELFGYERGAFTGAFQKKAGMFENADGGTILLDEIGDMEFRLQAKLLQVLQDSSFQRIGGKETIKVDVRIMAATHRELEKCIAERTFREDLYYRLNVINIQLPPLRERMADVLPLTDFLLHKHAAKGTQIPPITPELKEALTAYHWPGNVRELENVARKLLIFRDPALVAYDLRSKADRKLVMKAAASSTPQPPAPLSDGAPVLEQVVKAKLRAETDVILAALNSTRWNRKRAAAMLKIDYKALLYKMKKLGIEGAFEGGSGGAIQ